MRFGQHIRMGPDPLAGYQGTWPFFGVHHYVETHVYTKFVYVYGCMFDAFHSIPFHSILCHVSARWGAPRLDNRCLPKGFALLSAWFMQNSVAFRCFSSFFSFLSSQETKRQPPAKALPKFLEGLLVQIEGSQQLFSYWLDV